MGIGGGGNAFPFSPGSYAAGGEYQQIYSSQAFGGAVTLTSIAFASSLVFQPHAAAINYDVTLRLSNTTASTTAPSTNFAANKGANFATVFSGHLTANVQNNDVFDLIFPITPFLYNPSQGNLLLDVVMNSATPGSVTDAIFLGASSPSFPPLIARVFQSFGTGPAFTDNLGLFTGFGTAEIPEPSTWLLLGSGLAGLVVCRRYIRLGRS